MNPYWFSIYVLEAVWGPCKDTSGKVAGGFKEKSYRNHFKGCFSEGMNNFNWKGMRKEIHCAACHGQATDLEGKREKHISKNECELLEKNCWLLKSIWERTDPWDLSPERGSGKRNGYGFLMSLCVCARACMHTHVWVCIYVYVIYMWSSSALPKKTVCGNLVKTSMFAGFAITREGVTSKLGKTWMYGKSVRML